MLPPAFEPYSRPKREWFPNFAKSLCLSTSVWGTAEITRSAAAGVGVTELFWHLCLVVVVLFGMFMPICFCRPYQNLKSGLSWAGLGVMVIAVNIATMATYWPLKLVMQLGAERQLIEISNSLKPGEKRKNGQVGLFIFREAWKLPNGNTCFAIGNPGEATGLVYDPAGDPTGINEWTNIRIGENWSVVEQD